MDIREKVELQHNNSNGCKFTVFLTQYGIERAGTEELSRKMPGTRCAVFCCNNSRIVSKARGENIIFHYFPKKKDQVGTIVRREWIHRCKRGDKWNPDTSHICSKHFTEEDYERDLRNELLGWPVRKILKKTAVPTLNLPDSKQNENNLTSTDEGVIWEKKKEVQEILEGSWVTNKPSESTTTTIEWND